MNTEIIMQMFINTLIQKAVDKHLIEDVKEEVNQLVEYTTGIEIHPTWAHKTYLRLTDGQTKPIGVIMTQYINESKCIYNNHKKCEQPREPNNKYCSLHSYKNEEIVVTKYFKTNITISMFNKNISQQY